MIKCSNITYIRIEHYQKYCQDQREFMTPDIDIEILTNFKIAYYIYMSAC